MGVRRVLLEFDFKLDKPVPILSNNKSASSWANDERSASGRAKLIDVPINLNHDFVWKSFIEVVYVPSEDNDADISTNEVGPTYLNRTFRRIPLGPGSGGAIKEECASNDSYLRHQGSY